MRDVREINRGGFGIVYEVEENGQHFAKKVFDPQNLSADEREKLKRRFIREVRIQSRVRHPNIMPIYKTDLEASPPWFIMPLAMESFEQKIERDRAEGTTDPAAWQDILSAVEELHRLGYVHRDLKPANILYVDRKWVLGDFGLILPTVRETTILTGSNSAYGSHFYAAPEQAYDFHNVGEGADIFALGCILHDNVCPEPIRVPFAQIAFEGPYGPIIKRCTSVEVQNRYQNISALRAALFEMWQNPAERPAVSPEEADLLEAVVVDAANKEVWLSLIQHLEHCEKSDREPLLRQISAELLCHLQAVDASLFRRMMTLICNWVEGTGFDFNYCDVIGDRLAEVLRVSPIRVKCQIVIAALELAVYHNRWHVMHQVRRMLDQDSEIDLVDRIIIEMDLDDKVEKNIRAIEDVIRIGRNRWHPKIAAFLNSQEQASVAE